MEHKFTRDEALIAELHADRLLIQGLIFAWLNTQPDRRAAASSLLDLVSNSVEKFDLSGPPQETIDKIRGAMHERVQSAISSAANPKPMPPRPQKPNRTA